MREAKERVAMTVANRCIRPIIMRWLLTSFTAKRILQGEKKISLDLGLSLEEITIEKNRVIFPDNQKLSLEKLRKIAKDKRSVYFLENGILYKAQFFDSKSNRFYKLIIARENSPPTLEISGIHMHRIKDIDPLQDTERKVFSIPIGGVGLDICTGLGYTAIMASKRRSKVITIEKDKNVLAIARLNPWSAELFKSKKISIILSDAFYFISALRKKFDFIIHDPPRYAMAPELYSQDFYIKLFNALKDGRYMFHYTGKPEMKKGKRILANIKTRLKKAGFTVKWKEEALGYVCKKP